MLVWGSHIFVINLENIRPATLKPEARGESQLSESRSWNRIMFPMFARDSGSQRLTFPLRRLR
jgi:hypothetical protein